MLYLFEEDGSAGRQLPPLRSRSVRTAEGGNMKILDFIAGELNDFIWGWFGIAILLGTGVLMTVLTKFFQITHFGHWMKSTIGSIFTTVDSFRTTEPITAVFRITRTTTSRITINN